MPKEINAKFSNKSVQGIGAGVRTPLNRQSHIQRTHSTFENNSQSLLNNFFVLFFLLFLFFIEIFVDFELNVCPTEFLLQFVFSAVVFFCFLSLRFVALFSNQWKLVKLWKGANNQRVLPIIFCTCRATYQCSGLFKDSYRKTNMPFVWDLGAHFQRQ